MSAVLTACLLFLAGASLGCCLGVVLACALVVTRIREAEARADLAERERDALRRSWLYEAGICPMEEELHA